MVEDNEDTRNLLKKMLIKNLENGGEIYFELEELFHLNICMMAKINSSQLKEGNVSDEEYNRLKRSIKRFEEIAEGYSYAI